MAVTYGFFDSLNNDRVYDANQISEYFRGLITTGVYQTVGDGLQVVSGSGMTVNVLSGRAVIGSAFKWLKNDSAFGVTVSDAHATLNRYTAVIIKLDNTNRTVEITTKDGTAASTPAKPTMTNSASVNEMCLAYIYVPANSSSVTQANIEDTRSNNNLCGWVTGLIEQVDTTTLFDQWEAAYQDAIDDMADWETAQQAAFEAWLSALTEELNIGTYLQSYEKTVTLASADSRTIALDMTGYTYDATDAIFVWLNGLKGVKNTDWSINTSTPSITVGCNGNGDVVDIQIIKSVIGSAPIS